MKKSLGAKCLAFPLPAFLVGSYDTDGKPNIMTAAWGGILSSDPPCLGVSIRPERWTYAGIIKHQAFTVSIPNARLAPAVDFAGIVSGEKHDKFAAAGLTPVEAHLIKAPYVDECPVIIECRLINTLELGSHTLCVGQIMEVMAEEDIPAEGGGLNIAAVDPLLYNAGGDYHRVGESAGRAFNIGKALKKDQG